jgi:TolB-like protein/tetratricopeptide (TPR) repeat protein
MSLSSGTRLGPYEIQSLIGAGGMGEVYKARDTRLDRTVAIKVLPPGVSGDSERRARFEREAKAVAALDHPNIVTVFSVEEADGVPFFTMQYVEGRTLREADLPRGFPLPDLLKIAIPLADAVAAAHGRGILHRDLKPANVMLTPDGRVKVLDFGLAKLRDDPAPDGATRTASDLTSEGRVVGTVAYMSPEQAQGKPVDARSDVFSLGVLLYELATGQRPFAGDTSASVISAILRDTPPAVTALRPELPRDVARIVTRALHKDPEHRYQTAKDLRNDLEELKTELDAGRLESSASAAARETSLATVAASWRRHRAWLGLAAAALVVAAAVGAWRWTGAPATAPATSPLDPRRVAVAIFENRTGDPSLDAIGQLAAERITEGLPQIGSLQVVPTATVSDIARHARASAASGDLVQHLATATGAALVVSGAFHLEGNDLRVRARLTDASTGDVVLVDPDPGPRASPMSVIEATRKRVMGAVAVHLDLTTLSPLVEGTAPTYAAYQEYLAALDADPDGTERTERLNHALALDPLFVAARMALIQTLPDKDQKATHERILDSQREQLSSLQRLWLGKVRADNAGRNEEALVAAREAAKLAPNSTAIRFHLAIAAQIAGYARESVEALTTPLDWKRVYEQPNARGGYYFINLAESLHWLGEHERELAEVRRGRQVHPDLIFLRTCEGQALAALGRLGEIDRVVNEGLALAGNHLGMMIEIAAELRAHAYHEASLTLARKAVQWHANLPPAQRGAITNRFSLALSLQLAERWDDARKVYEGLSRDAPDSPEYLGKVGVLAARRGDRATALRISDTLAGTEHKKWLGYQTLFRAAIAAHLGDKDQGVELLRLALAQGLWYDIHLHHDLDLGPLKGYPPYEALIRPKD